MPGDHVELILPPKGAEWLRRIVLEHPETPARASFLGLLDQAVTVAETSAEFRANPCAETGRAFFRAALGPPDSERPLKEAA